MIVIWIRVAAEMAYMENILGFVPYPQFLYVKRPPLGGLLGFPRQSK